MLVAFNRFASEGHLAEALGKTCWRLQGNFAKRLRFASSAGFFRQATLTAPPMSTKFFSTSNARRSSSGQRLRQTPPPSTCNSAPNVPVKRYEHLTGPRIQTPSRAHARYSNDREFSTRQHAEKLPSVLKGNRKRIGKKAAQSNAERSGVRKACESRKRH